jgi:hypothetical protein
MKVVRIPIELKAEDVIRCVCSAATVLEIDYNDGVTTQGQAELIIKLCQLLTAAEHQAELAAAE